MHRRTVTTRSQVLAAAVGVLLAGQAAAQCGSGGSCFEIHGPGCSDGDCCAAVCAVDLFCCGVLWDTLCVGEASTYCVSAPIAGPFTRPGTANQYYILDAATWWTQRNAALALGGHLAVINSAEENQWVTDMVMNAGFAPDFFIGLSDIDVEGQFAWVDGSPLGFTNWDVGQPDNHGVGEDDVHIWSADGRWNDLPTTFVRIAVAEVDVTTCGDPEAGSCFAVHGVHCNDQACCESVCELDPTCCTTGWDADCVGLAQAGCMPVALAGPMKDPDTGRDYWLMSEAYWRVADAYAASLGNRLATIRDGRHNETIRRDFAARPPVPASGGCWIGAADAGHEGVFTWQDGQPLTYARWAPGQPDDRRAEDGVVLDPTTGEWSDAGMNTLHRWVMERARSACGTGAGCLAPHAAPGCGDEACCNNVCALDPPCCDVVWDAGCAGTALAMCEPVVVMGPIVQPANGHTYYGLQSGTWWEAERTAMAMGGHLAVPSAFWENEWLRATFVTPVSGLGEAAIGVHDEMVTGLFEAVSPGEMFLYPMPSWAPGEPGNLDSQDVVWMGLGGLWKDVFPLSSHPAIVEVPILGDMDGNQVVDGADLAALLGAWGRHPGPNDLNRDGDVDAADLAILLGHWGGISPGDCCTIHAGVGCDQAPCLECVCWYDPGCCDTAWDQACVDFYVPVFCPYSCDCGG